jgi:uncharacterized protein YggE
VDIENGEPGMRRNGAGSSRVSLLFLLALLGGVAMEARGQEAGSAAERRIRVQGVGELRVTPDQARISFAVETFAASARAAGEENARTMERVMAALVAAGVPRRDLETQNYSVFPEYVHDEQGREPRIRGYRVSNQVMLTTRELDRVGQLIDVALGAGANRMNGVHFSVTDADAATVSAMSQAVARARSAAEAIASALGVGLGPVMQASTSTAPPPPVPRGVELEAIRARGAADTPINPGEQVVRATVSLVFAIEDRG